MRTIVAAIVLALFPAAGHANDIASASLEIRGIGLAVETVAVTTAIDVPTTIQTRFNAPQVPGLLAVGDLTGPGLESSIRLTTAPGDRFHIPGFAAEGVYLLQNIRLMNGDTFIAPATPAVATITVANLLQTSVKVRQLSPEELRSRGISIDRSWSYIEYSFTFLIDGQTIEVPYPVVIDPRTHQVTPIAKETPYALPGTGTVQPPRWSPPEIVTFELPPEPAPSSGDPAKDQREQTVLRTRPPIPAAIVIPNALATLNQFFDVMLIVTNGAPAGSTAALRDVRATVKLPVSLRGVRSEPAVTFGQAVPIVDASNGVTFLVAQARGEAEWTLEGLTSGTHTVEIDLRATLTETGQDDVPLHATPRASIVVHDPRFNLTFSHPDTVRQSVPYSTYTFVTNTSAASQTIRIANGVPSCDQSPSANVCRLSGAETDELTLAAGEMRMIEYKLRPGVTGSVFATAGTIGDPSLSAAVQLHMGVSESGVPLSPATLVLPYYSRFLPTELLNAYLQLLGLGYSVATAPVTQTTAKFPRVIRTDVFFRAADLARAGQRIFIGDAAAPVVRDSLANLVLDLLGNAVELPEWDQLRRSESAGKAAGAAVMQQLRDTGMAGRASVAEFADGFASATAHRGPYALALIQGPPSSMSQRPYALSFRDSGGRRDVPFTDVSPFHADTLGTVGEIAIAGRWQEGLELEITPAVTGAAVLELIVPAAAGGVARDRLNVNLTAGDVLRVPLTRGGAAVAIPPLQIVAARQDLHLDPEGHKVSVLFNRRAAIPAGGDLRNLVSATISFNGDGVSFSGPRAIFGAALQEDGQIANLSFDAVLTTNASYQIAVQPLVDPVTGAPATLGPVAPKIDNGRDAAIVYGKFLRADNTPIASAEVRLYSGHYRGCDGSVASGDAAVDCNPYREMPQYVTSAADGTYLFEYVPRDVIADPALNGSYRLIGVDSTGRFTRVDGAVRLPRRVHFVNLQLLGRGAAEGKVRYENGEGVPDARVFVGSSMFDTGRSTVSDAAGRFRVDDLPVGPITFSATDAAGNTAFASAEIGVPGQIVQRDLVIERRAFPGTATVFGVVKRSDDGRPVAGARVGVSSQGYGLMETFTGTDGAYEFRRVPAGFVTVLASEWSVASESAAVDFDLRADETREVPPLVLAIRGTQAAATLTGDVIRENPLFPGDPSRYERVAGAVIRLKGQPSTVSDGNGQFVLSAVPLTYNNVAHLIEVYDPATKRSAIVPLPALTEAGPNHVAVFIAAKAFGTGTVRVRLFDALGSPATGFRVIEPGFPPRVLAEKGAGVYELRDVPAGHAVNVYAVSGPAAFGDQFAQTTARVEFPGQIATATIRLPGQGTVRVELRGDVALIGDVDVTYPAWDEGEQSVAMKTVTASTSVAGTAGAATFVRVPALQTYQVTSAHPLFGHAQQSGTLSYEGDLTTHVLQLNRLSTVSGTVYAIDGITPVPGASVRMQDGIRDAGVVMTQPDGSFVFHDVPADAKVRLIADVTANGIYRTGEAYAATPATGGVIAGVNIVLERRGSIEGRVVRIGYKRFDPDNPANNVPDDTPGDLSDNAPVPLARFWLRELEFPSRSFGSDAEPLTADADGRFAVGNVFVGALRVRAWDAGNQELQGTWTGALTQEGEVRLDAIVGVGGAGTGAIHVTVVDPNQQFLPIANAEVQLHRNGLFDLTTTDGAGVARFEQVPVGTCDLSAYAKSLGKSGTMSGIVVTRDATSTPRVTLDFSGKVDGALVDPESVPAGAGVAGAAVTLTATSFQTRTSTASSGAFAFDGIREGTFTLDAKDTVTNRRASARRTLSAADPHPVVNLELERTETLHLAVYLPDDTGARSGVLASPAAIEVKQRCAGPSCDVLRSTQGNPVTIPGALAAEPYSVTVREIGGESRSIPFSGQFPKGTAADPLRLVYPAYGSVEVTVRQNGAAATARVTVSARGFSVTLFTDAAGKAVARGVPLGDVSVQATSIDGVFSGSATGVLARQSIPLGIGVDLGAFAGVTGLVEAEAGGPSAGTRVQAMFNGRALEAITDGDGRYTFQGIPTSASGTALSLIFTGPDHITIGGRLTATITNESASRIVALPLVRLDSTPPQVVGVVPADGSLSVSPDTTVRIEFSEPVRLDQISNAFFQLVPADGSGQVMATFDPPFATADGRFVVTIRPPPPPAGQRFPLRSNTLYRVIVSGAIEDRTGHPLSSGRGFTFTTTDYAEPRVVKTVPSVAAPVPEQITFQFFFNEAIDPLPWQNGTASCRLHKLSAAGESGQVVAEKSGRAFLDPATGAILVFAPDQPIEPDSFYRVIFSGVRDLQGNALAPQTFHFFSFDRTRPFVRLISPVPDGFALVSGVEYQLNADLRNATADGTPASDIAQVEYVKVDGNAETFLAAVRTAPFAYRFVAPEVPGGGAALTYRARATDLSGNVSDAATITWSVRPNAAPANVVVTPAPSTAYPGSDVTAAIAFQDEGIVATVQVVARGTRQDGSAFAESQSRQLSRATVSDPWPACEFVFRLPADLQVAAGVVFTATVTDVRGLAATGSATIVLRADTIAPQFVATAPAAETAYRLNDQYRVEAIVLDAETGVAEVAFVIDGQTHRVAAASSVPGPVARSRTFATPLITVPARNVDRRVPVRITATDYHTNSSVREFEIVYRGVNDPAVPKAAWVCPIDRAALPAGRSGYALPLRVRAIDDIAVTAVRFRIGDSAALLDGSRIAGTDDYSAMAAIDVPAGGQTLTVTAIVSDADPAHTIELPIAIDALAIDQVVNGTVAITADNVAAYQGRSVVVESTAGRLVPHVPVWFANLLVLDGGRIESLATTTTTEHRVDVTVADHLFIDCASSVDVTGKGYLGGWALNPDGSGTRNDSDAGRTLGNTTSGGARDAGGSHGGVGGKAANGAANPHYGSISDPVALGSGGGGSPQMPGGAGGGAVSLTGAQRMVIAGAIHADGSGGAGTYRGGSGGSIRLSGRQVIAGPDARMTANGGGANPNDGSGKSSPAGGGGRVSVHAAERLDLGDPLLQLQARGGPVFPDVPDLEPGAGTVYVRRPSQTDGELFVASYPSAGSGSHWTGATPVSGLARFDAVTAGPFALLRFDESVTVAGIADSRSSMVVHPTAVVALAGDRPSASVASIPASGASVIRATDLELTIDAASVAGIDELRFELSGLPARTEIVAGRPSSVTGRKTLFRVAPEAPVGPASMTVTVTDRAGRAVALAPLPFVVIENQPPLIPSLTATPSLYPGRDITATVEASDDVSITRLALTAQIPPASPQTQVRAPNVRSARETFTVPVPIATPGGTVVTLEASAEDGYPGRPAVRTSTTVQVLRDANPPQASIVEPAANQIFDEGSGATFRVRVSASDAEVGVRTVTVRAGDAAPVVMTGDAANGWTATLPVPGVDGSELVPMNVVVTASDYEGNATVASIPIRIRPLIDPNGPAVRWTCGTTAGSMYPPGASAKLRVFAKGATPANGVQKVEFSVGGLPSLLTAVPVAGLPDHYEAVFVVPDLTDGSVLTLRAIATSVAGNQTDILGSATVVTTTIPILTSDTTIDASNAAAYDGRTVVVAGGTLTISGSHSFDRLIVLHGARVQHPPGGTTRVDVTAPRGIFVACDAAIDVSGKGFAAGQSYPGATIPALRNGGSHIGLGGRNTLPLGSTFGSVSRPLEAGGGADAGASSSAGGGVIRLVTATLTNDGAIRANGADLSVSDSRSGAGGSIWIRADVIHGSGAIEATGGKTADQGTGGGGAIAIEYAGGTTPSARAPSGTSSGTRIGGAGSVYLRGPGALFGELLVDNIGRTGEATELPSLGRGIALSGSSGATLVTDRSTDIPAFFAGHWVLVTTPAGTAKGIWQIGSVSGRTATLVVTATDPPSVDAGDLWFGAYRFDALRLRSSRLLTADRLFVMSPPDLDAASSIGGNNIGPPVVNAALVALQASPLGMSVRGAAGAVTDPDTPIVVIATNVMTGTSFSTTAAADGSFAVGITGTAGDRITVKARDGNAYPLDSAVADVGTLSAAAPAPVQLSKSGWTTDASFRAETIALDGSILAVSTSSAATGSDKLVVLNTAAASSPSHVRTVVAGSGPINDIEVRNGFAYAVSNMFGVVDLNSTASAVSFAADRCGREISVAVEGGYAFAGEADCSNTGRVHVYDVTTPAAPRFLNSFDSGLTAHSYTDLLIHGTSHLIGISDAADGRDVVVIDRRDVNQMRKVSELAIPAFEAWRGDLRGTMLYLVSRTSPEMVVVDVSNPNAPAIAGRLSLPSASGGVHALTDFVFAAATGSGLAAASVSPVSAVGSVPTGGVAMDVAIGSGLAYVANQIGVAVVPVQVAPIIDVSRIRLSVSGALALVSGSARAITGEAPVQVEVTNAAAQSAITLPVAADGSFNVSIPGSPGDAIAVRAIDARGAATGPISAGTVPFASGAQTVAISIAADPRFRARTVKVEGNVAVVGSYPLSGVGSDRLVTFDLSNPAAPVQSRIAVAGSGPIADFEIRGGWAYVAANRLTTIDLGNAASTINFAPTDPCGRETAVAVVRNYAFSAESDCNNDGRILIYDVSAPAAPRYLRDQSVGPAGHTFSDLIPLGSEYLVALSPSATGRDVLVIDIRDPNALRKAGELSIPEVTAFRGRVAGSTLLVAGQDGGVAVVDLSSPSTPRLTGIVETPGIASAIEVAGGTAIVADLGGGVAFVDVSATPRFVGSQPVAGDAWDVALSNGHLYVANEIGLAVLENVIAPPRIATERISLTQTGTVTGQPLAITGLPPLQVEIVNAVTGLSASVQVAANGSFNGAIGGSPGETITVRAVDGAGRSAGPVAIGPIPFGVTTSFVPITIPSDPNFRARTIRVDGDRAIVGGYPAYGTGSDKLVVLDLANPLAPAIARTVSASSGPISDFEVQNGWAYVSGNRFGTLDLTSPSSAVTFTGTDPCGRETAVTVSSGYAFAAEADCNNDGRIHVYDVTAPSVPRHLNSQPVAGLANHVFTDLLPLGTDYLIGISASVTGRDLMVIDRRDPNALRKVSELSIAGITGFRGKMAGSTLYIAGNDGGVALVDLSTPAAPVLLGVVDTPGLAYGVEASGTTAIVADRGAGISFLDGARFAGAQAIPGDAWDAALAAGNLYVAGELGVAIVQGVAAPPAIQTQLVTLIMSGANVVVTGAQQAVRGNGAVSVEARNETSGVSSPAVAVPASGSFTTSVAARPGERIAISATDGSGRRASASIGSAPFFTIVHDQPATSSTDLNLFARRIGVTGRSVIASGGIVYGQALHNSARARLFRQPDASAPAEISTIDAGIGGITDFEMSGSVGYFVGNRLTAVDFSAAVPVMSVAPDPCGRELAVAAMGTYLFSGESDCANAGTLNIYDVTAPLSPVLVRAQSMWPEVGVTYRDLIPLGSTHLAGVSNRGVSVIDVRTIGALARVGELNVVGFNGAINGTILYLALGDAGIAVIDLSNPAAPVHVGTVDTPGVARAVAVGTNEIVVADGGGPGLTFFDTSDPRRPVLLGSQPLPGNATDVKVIGSRIFAATETRFYVLTRP